MFFSKYIFLRFPSLAHLQHLDVSSLRTCQSVMTFQKDLQFAPCLSVCDLWTDCEGSIYNWDKATEWGFSSSFTLQHLSERKTRSLHISWHTWYLCIVPLFLQNGWDPCCVYCWIHAVNKFAALCLSCFTLEPVSLDFMLKSQYLFYCVFTEGSVWAAVCIVNFPTVHSGFKAINPASNLSSPFKSITITTRTKGF